MRKLSSPGTLIGAAALMLSAAAGAQVLNTAEAVKPAPEATVPVVVRTNKGSAVPGLTKDNFHLSVEGKPETLSGVSDGANQPITYGLVVDVGRTERRAIEDERKVGRAMMAALRPGDQMFVVQFAKPIELLTPPTADKTKLAKAIDEIGTSSASFEAVPPEESTIDSQGRRVRHDGTSLDDAIFLSADEVLSKVPGKHVLVVVSDGIDVGSKEGMTDTLEPVLRNGVIIYTLYAPGTDSQRRDRKYNGNGQGNGRNGSGWPGGYPGGYPGGGYPGGYPGGGYPGSYPGGGYPGNNPGGNNPNTPNSRPDNEPEHKPNIDGNEVLRKLSSQTGGRRLDLSGHIEQEIAGIADDLHSMYWLSFTPEGPAARRGYHNFDLTVSGSDKHEHVDLQTSDGYYMPGS